MYEKTNIVKLKTHNREFYCECNNKEICFTVDNKYIIETSEGLECANIVSIENIDIKNKEIEKKDYECSNKKFPSIEENGKCDKKNSEKYRKTSPCNIIRIASKEDIEKYKSNKVDALEAYKICKEKAKNHNLDLKLVSSYYFFDKSKLLFEFIADQRVDFRNLVKDLASHFKTRIELRQIGVRDEAKKFAGCGICGKEVCCSIIRNDFSTITVKMAKEQNMPLLTTSKISGQCGRLMCCLGYEYNTYLEMKNELPKIGETIKFNNTYAVIRDINPISKKLFIETEDKRLLYIPFQNATIIEDEQKV